MYAIHTQMTSNIDLQGNILSNSTPENSNETRNIPLVDYDYQRETCSCTILQTLAFSIRTYIMTMHVGLYGLYTALTMNLLVLSSG